MTRDRTSRAETRQLSCTACGAPLEIRAPKVTERVACGYCGSVLDASHPGLEIIQKFEKKVRYRPIIPLGQRGQIRGEKMECIGLQRRRVTVEGVNYEWSEYLLWNPYKGFRFLAECNGHWNYIKRTHVTPTTSLGSDGREEVQFLKKTYKHFQTARATTSFVVGEFNWQVKVGDTATCSDFVHPPYILSREHAQKEMTWSIGEYISPEKIWKAFKLPGNPREGMGVAPTQTWEHEEKYRARTTLWVFVTAALVVTQILFSMFCSNKQVHTERFTVSATDTEKSRVTKMFEVKGRTSNLEVDLDADVNNNWTFISMALINDKTDTALDFAREISYYHGSDSDGSWTEGGRSDYVMLPSVPPGTYYLRMEPQAGRFPVTWDLEIRRDVPLWRFLFMALFLACVPPLWLMYRRRSFEYQRWLESDHPMDPIIKFEGDE